MSGSNLARCWPLNGPGSLERQGTRESPLRAFPRQPPGGAISTEQFWGCPSWSEEKSQGRRLSRLTATPRDLQQLASWVVLVSSSDKAIQRAPQGACCRDHELAASPLHAEVSHWCGGATQGSLGFTARMLFSHCVAWMSWSPRLFICWNPSPRLLPLFQREVRVSERNRLEEAEGCPEEELMGTQKGTLAASRGLSLQ